MNQEILTKADITKLLGSNIVKVVFRKENGELREMICTLMSDLINYESAGRTVGESDDIVTCWDLEKDGWRRFKISNLLQPLEIIKY